MKTTHKKILSFTAIVLFITSSLFGLSPPSDIDIGSPSFEMLPTGDSPIGGGINTSGHPWPMYRGDERNTGCSSVNTSHNNGKLIWSFQSQNNVGSSPVIDSNGTVYITSYKDVYALYENGTVKWKYSPGGICSPSLAIDGNGSIFFGSGNNFYSLHSNGTVRWKYSSADIFWFSVPTICLNGT
ncbi:MAG: PQQ-like beta-propeller repeat protein, partial [Candidatus Thermoplasmatota archaeon]|nr:PQQ-like beta-propeller repeat protein [Candidatus Thermoplasmatota archaeon]